MSISKLMTQPVMRIDEDSTIQEAVEIMGKESFGTLLATRYGKDVGILTAGDIISKVVAKKMNLEMIKVKEIMSSPLVTIDKKTTGEDALRTMVKNDVRRLLITDNEEIVGIFTTSDITKLVPQDE
ncbi:CBS domain-containing protein [Candidatus Bathyarchaeota archaeon]|nr:CBS domain-containing protein [Candidatus Bathyarchaeota archaeon]